MRFRHMNFKSATVFFIGCLLIGGVGAYFFLSGDEARTPNSGDQRYENKKFGISFSYPNGYVLEEREIGSGEREHYAITLMRQADLPLPKDGEGPPTISIDVFQNNLDRLTLMQWLTETSYSNFKLSGGRYAETTVGGTSAVFFHWSGLYEGNTVAFLHGDVVVAISGTYLAPGDPIALDFEEVLASVRLD